MIALNLFRAALRSATKFEPLTEIRGTSAVNLAAIRNSAGSAYHWSRRPQLVSKMLARPRNTRNCTRPRSLRNGNPSPFVACRQDGHCTVTKGRMKTKEETMNKDCAFGFLIGLAAGAAIGVLCAPQSGVEFRRLVARKAKRGTDAIAGQATDLWDSASETVEKGRASVVRTQGGLKAAAEAGSKAYRESTT